MTALLEMHIRLGGDPRGLREFTLLRDEVAKLVHPARPDVDWAKVEQWCLTLFHTNGAELQTAASFALARGHQNGLQGMAQGVTLIEALSIEWPAMWPPKALERLDILAWLFVQWQSLLRSQQVTSQTLPALKYLCSALERLAAQLDRNGQGHMAPLQGLRQQVGSLMQRLECTSNPAEITPRVTRAVEPISVVPVVILPTRPLPKLPTTGSKSRKRGVAVWLFAFAALMALGAGFCWWTQTESQKSQTQQVTPETVHLDSLLLFDAGSTELKPGSTKVLVNALVNIKAQPGWLILITGHTDITGDAAQNRQLSYARAMAVRDWMKRMGDLPNDCFAVRGAAGDQPIASNGNAAGRAANRRVDIQLVPQMAACTLTITESSK